MFVFEIPLIPVPQKQTRFGRGHAYDPSKKDKETIQWHIKYEHKAELLKCPIKMELLFYLPIPKSASKIRLRQMVNQVILPISKPDVDNLAYLVTNALKGIVYADDAQIVDLILHKRYSEFPATVIKVIPIINHEQAFGDECD